MPTINLTNIIENKKAEEKNRLESLEEKYKNKEIILGIDLSKKKPGIAVVDLNQKKVVITDAYPSNEKNDYYRFLEIKYWLESAIKTFKPGAIMIEKEFLHGSRFGSKGTIPLLKLHGFVYYIVKSFGIPMYEILPSASRAFLKIKPNTKEEAFEFVKKNFQSPSINNFKEDNDKADAIIIALNYLNNKKVEL